MESDEPDHSLADDLLVPEGRERLARASAARRYFHRTFDGTALGTPGFVGSEFCPVPRRAPRYRRAHCRCYRAEIYR